MNNSSTQAPAPPPRTHSLPSPSISQISLGLYRRCSPQPQLTLSRISLHRLRNRPQPQLTQWPQTIPSNLTLPSSLQHSSTITHSMAQPIPPNLTQQPSPYQVQIEKWRKLVKRCHEVIGILLGSGVVFAPLIFLIQTVRSNGDHDPVHILTLILSFLQDFKTHLVHPFITVTLLYALFYTTSAADFPVLLAMWFDIVGIVSGFISAFVVLYRIWPIASIAGGCFCGVFLIGLFFWQFPRNRVAINTIGTP